MSHKKNEKPDRHTDVDAQTHKNMTVSSLSRPFFFLATKQIAKKL